MPAYNYSPGVSAAITAAAIEYGVPVSLAFADAEVESGGNPSAVGDNGTSFGLYQLHQGGELGSLTPAQAQDPLTNARVALKQFGNVMRSYPTITDPGQIAAKAQRPANPNAYAEKVDSVLNNYGTGTAVASPTTSFSAEPAASIGGIHIPGTGSQQGLGNPLNIPGDAAGAAGSAATSALRLPANWPIRLGYLIAGGILGTIGLLAVAFTLGGGKIAKAGVETAADALPEAAVLQAIAKGNSAKAPASRLQTKYKKVG